MREIGMAGMRGITGMAWHSAGWDNRDGVPPSGRVRPMAAACASWENGKGNLLARRGVCISGFLADGAFGNHGRALPALPFNHAGALANGETDIRLKHKTFYGVFLVCND